MTAEQFIEAHVAKQKAKAVELRSHGALESAAATEHSAKVLADDFREWWLSDLSISEAAEESGYCEERLRQLLRQNEIPHKKGSGKKGHLRIARCDLPRRPKAPAHAMTDIEERLLRGTRTQKAS